jgi:Fic family protein
MAEYPQTHPWIAFALDLSRLGAEGWMNLGEVRSKVEHIANAPLDPKVARELLTVWLVKGAQATTAIEGNSLSEAEVRAILEKRLELPPSQAYLERENANVLALMADVLHEIMGRDASRPVPITPEMFLRFNAEILAGLDLDEGVVPGVFREHSVVVGSVYRAPDAAEVRELVDRLCDWLNGPDFVSSETSWAIPTAVLRAIAAHLCIAWVHPFGDGNGRTARMVEFAILLDAGFPAPSAHLLANHYNRTRSQYGRELTLASRMHDPLPFLRYAVQGLVDGLAEQITAIRIQQYDDRWEQWVFQAFGGALGATAERRRRLAIALGKTDGEPTRLDAIASLTPALARAYAGKTSKTVTRDINALVVMDLVARGPKRGTARARKEVVLSLLPLRR